jgi:hypothetical protein
VGKMCQACGRERGEARRCPHCGAVRRLLDGRTFMVPKDIYEEGRRRKDRERGDALARLSRYLRHAISGMLIFLFLCIAVQLVRTLYGLTWDGFVADLTIVPVYSAVVGGAQNIPHFPPAQATFKRTQRLSVESAPPGKESVEAGGGTGLMVSFLNTTPMRSGLVGSLVFAAGLLVMRRHEYIGYAGALDIVTALKWAAAGAVGGFIPGMLSATTLI